MQIDFIYILFWALFNWQLKTAEQTPTSSMAPELLLSSPNGECDKSSCINFSPVWLSATLLGTLHTFCGNAHDMA